MDSNDHMNSTEDEDHAFTHIVDSLDDYYLQLAFNKKNALYSTPMHSNFRVFAVIVFRTPSGEIDYVCGTNNESVFIGQSICAERNAIGALRLKNFASIEKIYIVSDSPTPLNPGLLCREYLSCFISPTTPIVLASEYHPERVEKRSISPPSSSSPSSSSPSSSIASVPVSYDDDTVSASSNQSNFLPNVTSDNSIGVRFCPSSNSLSSLPYMYRVKVVCLRDLYPFPCLYAQLSGKNNEMHNWATEYVKYAQKIDHFVDGTCMSIDDMMSNEIHVHNVIRQCTTHAWVKRRQAVYEEMLSKELEEQKEDGVEISLTTPTSTLATTDENASASISSTSSSSPSSSTLSPCSLPPTTLTRLRHEADLLCQDTDTTYEQQDILSTHIVYQHMLHKLHAALQRDNRDAIHGIRYAAALLLRNGEILTAHQHKVAEYGHSLDAVVAVYALWRDKAEREAQEDAEDEAALWRRDVSTSEEGKEAKITREGVAGSCGQCAGECTAQSLSLSLASQAHTRAQTRAHAHSAVMQTRGAGEGTGQSASDGATSSSTGNGNKSGVVVSGDVGAVEPPAKKRRACSSTSHSSTHTAESIHTHTSMGTHMSGTSTGTRAHATSNVNANYVEDPYQPLLLLLRDNYGVLHAPFAPARALFAEMDANIAVLCHDSNGDLICTNTLALASEAADVSEGLALCK